MSNADRPTTKIFLDSGDPVETKQVIGLLGYLDGQTTNPTLISKNPFAKDRFARGEKFTRQEIIDFYKQIVQELSRLVPAGSISIEVYADTTTTADEMFAQGKEFFDWIPNAHIKYPTTAEGLRAAEQSVREGMRVNMTLVFSQAQAAAVHAATRGAPKGDVFVSPFVGRLDDRGHNGMDLIANIIQMYQQADSHVSVLTASVRTLAHHLRALQLGSDIITAPFSVLEAWAATAPAIDNFVYSGTGLAPIPYQTFDLSLPWDAFTIDHELTKQGIEKFAADWNALIAQ